MIRGPYAVIFSWNAAPGKTITEHESLASAETCARSHEKTPGLTSIAILQVVQVLCTKEKVNA